jgi:hypothetical protein
MSTPTTILLIGATYSGKTTFVKNYFGLSTKHLTTTQRFEIHQHGNVTLIDSPGQTLDSIPNFDEILSSYKIDHILVFISALNRDHVRQGKEMMRKFATVCPNFTVVRSHSSTTNPDWVHFRYNTGKKATMVEFSAKVSGLAKKLVDQCVNGTLPFDHFE